jgi:hypothetical protein
MGHQRDFAGERHAGLVGQGGALQLLGRAVMLLFLGEKATLPAAVLATLRRRCGWPLFLAPLLAHALRFAVWAEVSVVMVAVRHAGHDHGIVQQRASEVCGLGCQKRQKRKWKDECKLIFKKYLETM